jgi:hypothetical protein
VSAGRPIRGALLVLPLLAGLAGIEGEARADELKFDFSGKIQTDLRFRLQSESVGSYYDLVSLAPGIERNQNLLSLKFKATYGHFSGVASADMYLNGVSPKVTSFSSLQDYNAARTFSFEPQAIYLEGKGLFTKGLDLRIGDQIVSWGVGDQFNPTNNLNANDLRDPLLFGKQQANFMVKLDYWLNKDFSFSGVLVPIFRPALLPASSALGAADIQRMPFVSQALRNRIESESGYGTLEGYPTVVGSITPVLPTPSLDNMQVAYRVAGTIGEQDVALSYYYGRTDFPQPFENSTKEVDGKKCNPAIPSQCIAGVLQTDVQLGYPRMHVYGFNMSGEFNPFKKIKESIQGIGYRVEAALVVPQAYSIELVQGPLPGLLQQGGIYDYLNNGIPGGPQPNVVDPTPFVKWTIGLDYSFGAHVYTNAQWVHGLVDEFGTGVTVRQSGVLTDLPGALVKLGLPTSQINAQCVIPKNALPLDYVAAHNNPCATETFSPRIGDYLVLGVDFKFLDDAALFRIFTIWSLSGVTMERFDRFQSMRVDTHYSLFTSDGFSAVLYPELDYNFGNGLELGTGALVLLGHTYTKFGDPAAGGSVYFTRGRFSF